MPSTNTEPLPSTLPWASVLPYTISSIVLRHGCGKNVALPAVAWRIAEFALKAPTWDTILSSKSTDAIALKGVQWLYAHDEPDYLFRCYCGSCHGVDFHSSTSMDRAAKRGFLRVVKYMEEHSYHKRTHKSIVKAASNGHLEVVQFLCDAEEEATEKMFDRYTDPMRRALEGAAKGGYLDVVQYLHESMDEPLTRTTWLNAVASGNIDLIWYVWDRRPGQDDGWSHNVVHRAAAHGHLHVLKWWLEKNGSLNHSCRHAPGGAIDAAAASTDINDAKSLEVIKYLNKQLAVVGVTTNAMDSAAGLGKIEVVKFLHFNRREGCTTKAMDGAAGFGSFELVEFLQMHRTEGCTTSALRDAVVNGHTDIVQFLLEKSPSATAWSIDDYALYHCLSQPSTRCLRLLCDYQVVHLEPQMLLRPWSPSIEMAQYLFDSCLALTSEEVRQKVISDAVAKWAGAGQLSLLQLVESWGLLSESCGSRAMDAAAAKGYLHVVKYLHACNFSCTTAAMDNAAANGHLDVVRFLHHHRSEGCSTAAVDGAAGSGHLAVVKFLYKHRSERCTTEAIARAATGGHRKVVEFLHETRREVYSPDELVLMDELLASVQSHPKENIVNFCHYSMM